MPSTPKSRPDAKNTIYITENIAVVSPSTASGFGAGGAAALASGVQLHFPTISGNIILASGVNIITSGSELVIPILHISDQLLLTSGTPIRSSGTSLTIYPQITTAAITSGTIINSPTISGIFQGGLSGVFDNLRVNNILSVGESGLFVKFVDMSQIAAPSDPLSGHANIYVKQIDSTNDGLYTKIRIGDAIAETLVAPIGLAGTAVSVVVSGRFSGQQLWLSGATIITSGSSLTIFPQITTAALTSGTIIDTATVSGVFAGGQSGVFANLVVSGTSVVNTASVSGTITSTTGVFNAVRVSGGINAVSGTFSGLTVFSGVFQSLIVSGTLVGNSGVFDTIQISSNLMVPGFQNYNYIVWRETNTYKARNLSGIIQFSGTNATTVLQNCLQSGMSVALTPHVSGYLLASALHFSGDSITLKGTSQAWFSPTALKVSASFSAIIVEPGSAFSLIQDLCAEVTFSGYTSSLVWYRGPTTDNKMINVTLVNPITPGTVGVALDTMTGNGLELDNLSGATYRNNFDHITIVGGKNGIYANATSGITFMNDNTFTNLYCNSNVNGVYVKSPIGGSFDNNSFISFKFQATSGSHTGFDYRTEKSGHVWYTRHMDVMVWDVAGFGIISGTYALMGGAVDLDTIGCQPTWLVMGDAVGTAISGMTRYDIYTQKSANITLVAADGANKEFLVSHGLNRIWAPKIESLIPITSGARGDYHITSGNANSFFVNYTTAPANGAAMGFFYKVRL